jgi:uncharacterized protein
MTGHHAPWPQRDLDVGKILAAGHTPVPFRQFILRINSHYDLSCSYCDEYEIADQGRRGVPRLMSWATAKATVTRIAEHAKQHGLPSVEVVLYGSEPLLTREEWLTELVGSVHTLVPARVNVAIQTNGTLLDRPRLEVLKRLGIQVSISLDGDAEAIGHHRRYANGCNSFNDVADGLYLLGSPEFHDLYGCILCTIDVRKDPVATYEALLRFGPPELDFLLPHANWSSPPPGSGYGDWLISAFERWYSPPVRETRIRLFAEMMQLVLGQPCTVDTIEGLGLLPSTRVVIETDGSIKQFDSPSSSCPGAADTGLHVSTDAFDAALDHPSTVARQIGADALSSQCRTCPVMEICGGGLYPHRYRDGAGFRHPSVYCADLMRLVTHVRARVIADVAQRSTATPSSTVVNWPGGRGRPTADSSVRGDQWLPSSTPKPQELRLMDQFPIPEVTHSLRGPANIIALPPNARTTQGLTSQGRAVFISYSHRDRKWIEHLLIHLKPLQRENLLDIWDDSRIRPGTKWRDEIEEALNKAAAAILVISPNFLASDFVINDEVPALLHQAESRGTFIIPLIVAPSLFGQSMLSRFQAINPPEAPLSKLKSYKRDEVLVKVATSIGALFT